MGLADGSERLHGDPDSSGAAAASRYAPHAPDDAGASCSIPAGSLRDRCPYQTGPRNAKDVWWFRALLGLGAACVLGGIVAAATCDKRLFMEPSFLEAPSACARPGFAPRALMEDRIAAAVGVSGWAVVLWLVLSLVLPLALGVVWLKAWARHAQKMIWVSAGIHVASLTAAAVLMFTVGAAAGGGVMLFLAVVVAVLWGCCRRQMALCARLLSVAAHGLEASPGLMGLGLALWAAGGAVLLAATGFGLAAFATGGPAPNPLLTSARRLVSPPEDASPSDLPPAGESFAAIYAGRCELDGSTIPCCSWQTSPGGGFLIFLLCVTALWAFAALGAARQFAVSGVVAQWYYAPAGCAPTGALRATLRHALGPQRGTVCFAGAVMALIQALRQAADSGTRTSDGRQGAGAAAAALLCCVLRAAAQCVLSVAEFLCRYALTWAALTGQGLVDAGKEVTALLKRNLLDAVTVWWMPGAVVGLTSFALAALWGCVVFAAVALSAGRREPALPAAAGVGALGGLAAGLVLQLLGRLLLDAVDTVFVCWACDRDQGAAGRADVDEVLAAVATRGGGPAPGAVVSQPHGGYAYGASDAAAGGGGGGGSVQMTAPPPQAPPAYLPRS
ncbi:MAG: plasma-membrane choline transporter-domain-containing protein [Monoraphidium minutum]|nr:MAG: plasma-membrane choline transporter-domain-containing protein [Monoraphidium minutum]